MSNDFLDAAESVADLRDNLEDEITSAVIDGMNEVTDITKRNLRRNDSIARGNLRRGILPHHKAEAATTHIVESRLTFPDWAKYLEYGTGRHGRFPAPSGPVPYDNILTWVVEKNVQPRQYDSQYELAEALSVSIGEQGNRAHSFVRPAWFRGVPLITTKARRAMRQATRRSF